MRDFVIVTDSNSDIPIDIIQKYKIPIAEIECTIDGKDIKENLINNMDLKGFYESMKKGIVPHTSMISPAVYINIFENILKQNKDVIYICISSQLSGTYNSALIARDYLLPIYKEGKIEVIDSLSATMQQGLLVYEAYKLKENGQTFQDIVNWLKNNLQKFNVWFMVDDLDYLKNGGRISSAEAIIGKTLNIKPILTVNKEGKIVTVEKVRGRKKAMHTITDKFKKQQYDIRDSVVCILHSDCEEDAEILRNEVKEFSPKEILFNEVRTVIGTHTGPNALAIAFYGEERKQ